MYNGRNPKALASQEWLACSLFALMEQKPYEEISVREICAGADLSRQTFYNCFDGKEELIRFRIRQCYQEMLARLEACAPLTLADITGKLTETLQNNRAFFRLLLEQRLELLLCEELSRAIQLFAGRLNVEAPAREFSYSTAFLTGAIVNTAVCWFKDPDPIAPEELAGLLSGILAGGYYRVTADGSAGGTAKP